MADDPDLTGRVRLDLSGLVEGLRFAQAVTRRQIGNLVRDANQRLAGLDTSRLSAGMARVGSLIGGLGRLAVPFAAAGAAVGSLLPLVAGLAAALAALAPAAAVAVSGFLAMQLVAGTFKLAMTGVEDAVKAALDPSDPEAYAEALKKLSPNARSFVGEIRKAQPALDKIRKTVQDKVFAGLDTQLRSTAKAALPALRTALNSTATTLNQMGKGVFTAARNLAKDGTLGTALKGATDGLAEFRKAPGQVVTALGQIGAAAAPAFRRLSKAGAGALDRLSEKITQAFESGAMEKAIDTAIDLFAQLGRVVGNIGGILKNVFGGLTSSGQGLFSTLETITASLREATGTAGFQRALAALSQTMGVVATTVGPLLGQALGVLGPVIERLAGPAQQLVRVLGDALGRVLTALGPVLSSLATAFGALVVALLPIVDVAADLISALLPALVPLFDSLSQVLVALSPVIAQIAENLAAQLVPLLAALGPILTELLPPFVELAETVGPQLTQFLSEMTPYLADAALKFADMAIAMAPLTAQLFSLAATIAGQVMPVLGPVLVGLIIIVTTVLGELADIVTRYVIPAVKAIGALLTGDFSGALGHAGDMVDNFKADATSSLRSLLSQASPLLAEFAATVARRALEAGQRLALSVAMKVTEAVGHIRGLPARITAAIPSAGSILQSAGRLIIQGLISGISSQIGALKSKLASITDLIPKVKGPPRKDATLLTPAGKSIIQGLIDGIDASTGALKAKLRSITNVIERAISINKGNKNKASGLGSLLNRVEKDTKRLSGLAVARDKVAARLKAAQKRLDDAIKERTKAAADIRDGILGGANITTGHNTVNSVTAITIGLQQAAAKAKVFAANLAALKKAGLRSDLLGDIASAGVDGGAATAAALARATPEELKKINALQAQLAATATSTGNSVAGAMYDSGVKAAQGLVDGLKKQQGAIEKQMEKIAAAMVKAIKKALKIKSPSRVFQGIGEMSGAGLRDGMLRSRKAVAGASSSMAAAAVGAADVASRALSSVPSPGSLTAAYAGTQGGGDTYNITMNGTRATPTELVHELSWRGLVAGRKG